MEFENMQWLQVLSLFLANAGLIVWFRAESRSDWRHMDSKVDSYRQETQAMIDAIRQDMNDFHTRLCVIEERNRK